MTTMYDDTATTGAVPPMETEIHPRNQLNDLTAKSWITETVSVWRQKGLGADHPDSQIEKLHPAPFSFTDVARLVRFFSKKGHTVLDPFVGIGSTLKAAALEGRKGIGIELNPLFVEFAQERLEREVYQSLFSVPKQHIMEGDARDILKTLNDNTVDFVVTSPPYWNILHKQDHKVEQERVARGLATRYSQDDVRDLGNIKCYDKFVEELVGVFRECSRILREKRYLAIVVGDFRDKSQYKMFHADLASELEAINYVLKGVKILYQPNKRVFPYGYPYAYVPNIHHQSILIMRNENK